MNLNFHLARSEIHFRQRRYRFARYFPSENILAVLPLLPLPLSSTINSSPIFTTCIPFPPINTTMHRISSLVKKIAGLSN